MSKMKIVVRQGDCREILKTLRRGSIYCCVTSPPYFGLRDYGDDKQIGLETSVDAYVAELVAVFREVKRVLRDDGTLWLNLGDSYGGTAGNIHFNQAHGEEVFGAAQGVDKGGRSKDLLGIPWRVAFALQKDGWYLRQDIIWSKPNPMPESVTDRCTKAHEYIFLMSKSSRYHYDAKAIAEKAAYVGVRGQDASGFKDPKNYNGKYAHTEPKSYKGSKFNKGKTAGHQLGRTSDKPRASDKPSSEKRNKRSVWEVATEGFDEAHFAVFPSELITPCILAGCPRGGWVLDPFAGSGTTGFVAKGHNRNALLIELNPKYAAMIKRRTNNSREVLKGKSVQEAPSGGNLFGH
jgi:DNA modification methylase